MKKGNEHLVCQLKKSLYGLKQAPRQWYRKFDSFMTDQGYHKTQADHCVFVKKFEGGDFLILLLYVDDMLIVGRDQAKIRTLKKALNRTFSMKDLGPARQIHHPGPEEEAVVAVTREVRDKGASPVQHVGSKTGRVDPPGKLQVVQQAKSQEKG